VRYQNHRSGEKMLAKIQAGIQACVEGAYVEILVHLIDEFVLGVGK